MNGNGSLTLYYNQLSFYSQRALFTLLEKGLSFKEVIVEIGTGEQYRPEYLRLNPKGTVPTLQDGVKVIPDSALIMEYLEDNFTGDKYPRLLPADKSSETYRKVMAFEEEFLKLNVGVFTYGSMNRPELWPGMRLPKMLLKKKLKATTGKDGLQTTIDSVKKEMPELRADLEKKQEFLSGFSEAVKDPARYAEVVRTVEALLQRAEDELVTHTGDKADWWLYGPSFTLADIDLCILLNRIWVLGLDEKMITRSRPHLATYLRRARQRKTFQRTTAVPFKIRTVMFAEKVASYLPMVIGVGAVLAAAYGVYVARRGS